MLQHRILNHFLRERPLSFRIALTAFLVSCAVLLNAVLLKQGWGELLSALLGAAVVSAIYAGARVALLGALVGLLVLDYFVVTPGEIFDNHSSIIALLLYAAVIYIVGTALAEVRKGYRQLEVAQNAAQAAKAEAERAANAREHVIGIVSHDLRNPLASVEMNMELLRREQLLTPKLQVTIQSVSRSVVRMKRIIEDLLDAVKIDTGTFSIELKSENVSSLIQESLEPFGVVAEKKQIKLTADIECPDGQLLCDRSRIIQALSNLIQNAIKFSDENGHVRVIARETDDQIRFSVSDDGPGIAAADLPHLFDRYWRSKNITEGTGLGLYIVRGITASHGGSVNVRSMQGQGSTFVIAIPKHADARRSRVA